MTWYLLERDESARDLLLSDEAVVQQTQSMGLSCSRTRKVFGDFYGESGPTFRLISGDGLSLVEATEEIPDLLIWSWLPVFSSRAKEVLSNLLEGDDFMPCRVEGAKQRDCFIHLPRESADGLLVEQSKFKSFVPMSPPIPIGAVELVVDPRLAWRGNMVRVAVPSTGQVLSELFVSGALRSEWLRHDLLGAAFREISVTSGSGLQS